MTPADPTVPPDPSAPPPEEQKKSGWRWLIGCAILFGSLVLLMMLIAGGAAFWFLTSGASPETTPFVGEDAWLVAQLNLDPEDPATAALVEAAMEGFEDRQRREGQTADMPGWVRTMSELNQSQGTAVLRRFAPEHVLLVLFPGEGDAIHGLGSVRLGYLPRMYQTLFSTMASQGVTDEFEEHGDYTLVPGDDGGGFSLIGRNIVFADRIRDLGDALDRLDMSATPGPLWSRLSPLIERGQGQLVADFTRIETPFFDPSCQGLGAWLELGDGERMTLQVAVDCGEEAPARDALRAVLERTRDQMAEDGLEATVYVPETGVGGTLEVQPVASWLRDVFSGARGEPTWVDALGEKASSGKAAAPEAGDTP